MKTCNGIFIDLIEGESGLKPLEIETEDVILVRMPHGQFRVRVLSPALANITVTLDGAEVLATQVKPNQLTVLSTGSDGRPFTFGDKPSVKATDQPVQPALFVEAPAKDTREMAAPSHGLVIVSAQFAEQGATAPGVKPGPAALVFFQMNTHRDHLRAVAANLHRVIPPEGVTRRRCSCCP
jgi:hypothetical protein